MAHHFNVTVFVQSNHAHQPCFRQKQAAVKETFFLFISGIGGDQNKARGGVNI